MMTNGRKCEHCVLVTFSKQQSSEVCASAKIVKIVYNNKPLKLRIPRPNSALI